MGSNVLCRYEIKGDLDAVNPFASGWGGGGEEESPY